MTDLGKKYYIAKSVGEPHEKMISGAPVLGLDRFPVKCLCQRTKYEKRIYDRVFEMCVPVQMKGVSKRKMSADNKIKLLRELNNREG